MKLTVGELRYVLHEAAKVGASPEYLRKEQLREVLQGMIAEKVASGEVVDQGGIDQVIKDITMALGALKMVPFEVWSKLSATKKPSKNKTPKNA